MSRRSLVLTIVAFFLGFAWQCLGGWTFVCNMRHMLAPAQELTAPIQDETLIPVTAPSALSPEDASQEQERSDDITSTAPTATSTPTSIATSQTRIAPGVTRPLALPLTLRRNGLQTPMQFPLFGLSASIQAQIDAVPAQGDAIPVTTPQTQNNDEELPVYASNWAKFKPGAWIRKRITSVAYENNKPIQSVTETKVELLDVDLQAQKYTLAFDSTVKVGNVDYSHRHETVDFDFLDQPWSEDAKLVPSAPVNLIIGQRVVPCQTRTVEKQADRQRERAVVYYSSVVAPYVMQREVTREIFDSDATDANATRVSHELYVVQQTESRQAFGTMESSGYVALRSIERGKRKQNARLTCSSDVPGGIIKEYVTEFDPLTNAALLQTNTVLLDYYVP